MSWIILFIAGLLEIGWAVALKLSEGFTRPVATTASVVLMLASFVTLSLAIRTIPLGTGYAVWTGIGVAGTAIVGMIALGEPRTYSRALCILLILIGILGLRLTARN